MALVKLGNKSVGSIVNLKVGGVAKEFIVVHQGKPSSAYDESCNGTWLLMKDCYDKRQLHSVGVNDYANSDINKYLNGTFLGLIDEKIRGQIKQVKIPYRPGSGAGNTINSGSSGLLTRIFLLGVYEIGWTNSNTAACPVDGAKLAYFGSGTTPETNEKRKAYLNGVLTVLWTRTPYCKYTDGGQYQFIIQAGGTSGHTIPTGSFGVRPALVLPSTLFVGDDGTIITNTAPTTPGSINVPAQINGGSTITVSWAVSSDDQGNLEGYKLERSTDGGSSWQQVYQGAGTSTTNTVAFGTASVMYRVRSYDSEGLHSGYRISEQVSVINNNAPTAPPSITVPNTVLGGATLAVTWGAASDQDGNLSGYSLERQVDGGAWAVIYSSNTLSYTDTITKGWATVSYRVRAYDSNNAYSEYAVSPERAVNNNTAPTIVCTPASGTDLGTKDAGFMVSYSVSDVDGDVVTVTEAIDGVTKRTFTATLDGSNSFNVTGEYFMKLLNGSHTMTITANDGKVSAVHTLTFTKEVTAASVTLEEPMEADAPITICVLSVAGFIPLDAAFSVKVTNNAKDPAPVWEDCTTEVKVGANHVFTNTTAANGPAFNFIVEVERGTSGVGGYITSAQGGFQ